MKNKNGCLKTSTGLALAISLMLPPPGFADNLRATQLQDDPSQNSTLAGLEEALRRAGRKPALANRSIAPSISQVTAGMEEKWPKELGEPINANDPSIAPLLQQMQEGLVDIHRDYFSRGDITSRAPQLMDWARQIRPSFNSSSLLEGLGRVRDAQGHVSQRELDDNMLEVLVTLETELNLQVFMPANLFARVHFREDTQDYGIVLYEIQKDTWRSIDYLGSRSAVWTAAVKTVGELSQFGFAFGNFVLADAENLRAREKPFYRKLMERWVNQSSIARKLGEILKNFDIDEESYGLLFGENHMWREETQHAKDFFFSSQRYGGNLIRDRHVAFKNGKALVRPESPFFREFEEVAQDQDAAASLGAGISEFSGQLGSRILDIEHHLEQGRSRADQREFALAYGQFLDYVLRMTIEIGKFQAGTIKENEPHFLASQMFTATVQQEGIPLDMSSIESGLPPGSYEAYAERAKELLQRIYDKHFWWSEQDRSSVLAAGLEEPELTSASQPIDETLISDPYKKYQTLIGIVEIQVQAGQFEQALATVGKISGYKTARVLAEIALAQAQAGQDPTRTLEEALAALDEEAGGELGDANRPKSERTRKVLSLIAQTQAQLGQFEAAKATAQRARFLYQGAVEVLFGETPILADIARVQAQAGKFDEAFSTLLPIPIDFTHDGRDKIRGLVAIAQARAQAGQDSTAMFQEALVAARRILSSPSGLALFTGLGALMTIAQAQAKAGQDSTPTFQEALAIVKEEIRDSVVKSSQLTDIALAQAQAGQDPTATFQRALAEARTIFSRYDEVDKRSKILAQIAEVQVKTGQVEAALSTVQEIQTDSDKVKALTAVIASMREVEQLQAVLGAAQNFPSGYHKNLLFAAIAGALARLGQSDMARDILQKVDDDFKRDPVLAEIAKAQARAGQFEQALATSREIKYAVDQWVDVLTAIAQAQAKAGQSPVSTFQKALDIARSLEVRSGKFEQLAKISTAQTQAGDLEAALTTAGEIPDEKIKSDALSSIVLAQARLSNAGQEESFTQTGLAIATATALRSELNDLPRVTISFVVSDPQKVLIVTPDGLHKLLLAAAFVPQDPERPLLVEALANDAAHQIRVLAGLEELGLKGVRVHDVQAEFGGNIGEAITQLQMGHWQEGKETLVVTALSGLEEITRFLGVPGVESELRGFEAVIDRSQAVWS